MDWWGADDSLAVDATLRAVHDEQAADIAFLARCDACMAALKEVCSAALSVEEFKVAPFDWTPDVRLERFGSTLQGVALMSSDLDVRMTFEQFCVHGQERQMKYLKGVAAAPGERFEVVRLVVARLPVLRLRFEGCLEVDLTLGGGVPAGGSNNGEDLRFVDGCVAEVLSAALDDGARKFVRLVKAFSKANNLVDAFNGFLNSASWAFLAIVFLQTERCLPSYVDVQAGRKDCRLWPTRLTASLLARFFGFVERCGKKPHKVSVLKGVAYRAREHTIRGDPAPPLVVEHPWKLQANIALCLTPPAWKHTVQCCARARKALSPPTPRGGVVAAVRRVFEALEAGGEKGDTKREANGEESPSKRSRTA